MKIGNAARRLEVLLAWLRTDSESESLCAEDGGAGLFGGLATTTRFFFSLLEEGCLGGFLAVVFLLLPGFLGVLITGN